MKKCVCCILMLLLLCSCGINGEIKEASGTKMPIDLNSTYDCNDLIIEDFIISVNDDEGKIPQIKGLKDTSVQNKINTDMKKRAMELIDKYSTARHVDYYTYSNFANVISISFGLGFEEEPYYENIYFNYNLLDGERLKLEDLFMDDADILTIVRQAFYNSFTLYGNYDTETELFTLDENQLYKTVKSFMANENRQFAFTPTEIYFYNKTDMASVKMIDIYDQVCIYSNFTTPDSIYTGEYQGFKNIFTCATSNYEIFDMIEYGFQEENLWTDITVGESYFPYESPLDADKKEEFNLFRTEKLNEAKEEIERMRKVAKENPDKFYVLLLKPNVNIYCDSEYENGEWHYTYSSMASFHENIHTIEMTMDFYNSTFKNILVENYRYDYFAMRGGAYFDPEADFGFPPSYVTRDSLYNYHTGEKVTTLEELFYPDSGYMDYIRERTVDYLTKTMNVSTEGAELMFPDAVFTIEGTTIRVSIPYAEECNALISLYEFDKSMLKIWEE